MTNKIKLIFIIFLISFSEFLLGGEAPLIPTNRHYFSFSRLNFSLFAHFSSPQFQKGPWGEILAGFPIAPEEKAVVEKSVTSCLANLRVILGAVEMYNMDHSTMMETLNLASLVKEGYLKSAPACNLHGTYRGEKLTSDGTVSCDRHGTPVNPLPVVDPPPEAPQKPPPTTPQKNYLGILSALAEDLKGSGLQFIETGFSTEGEMIIAGRGNIESMAKLKKWGAPQGPPPGFESFFPNLKSYLEGSPFSAILSNLLKGLNENFEKWVHSTSTPPNATVVFGEDSVVVTQKLIDFPNLPGSTIDGAKLGPLIDKNKEGFGFFLLNLGIFQDLFRAIQKKLADPSFAEKIKIPEKDKATLNSTVGIKSLFLAFRPEALRSSITLTNPEIAKDIRTWYEKEGVTDPEGIIRTLRENHIPEEPLNRLRALVIKLNQAMNFTEDKGKLICLQEGGHDYSIPALLGYGLLQILSYMATTSLLPNAGMFLVLPRHCRATRELLTFALFCLEAEKGQQGEDWREKLLKEDLLWGSTECPQKGHFTLKRDSAGDPEKVECSIHRD